MLFVKVKHATTSFLRYCHVLVEHKALQMAVIQKNSTELCIHELVFKKQFFEVGIFCCLFVDFFFK